MNRTEQFIRGSNNLIELILTEDDDPILGVWNTVRIHIGRPSVEIWERNSPGGDGITFDSGVLAINPGLLLPGESDDLDEDLYPLWITVESSADVQGVDFGAPDSEDQFFFQVTDRPG
jgi:hypothetical protein